MSYLVKNISSDTPKYSKKMYQCFSSTVSDVGDISQEFNGTFIGRGIVMHKITIKWGDCLSS